ncbi:hypothetical protein TWF281_009743 [Arthrobotrys megalospora]
MPGNQGKNKHYGHPVTYGPYHFFGGQEIKGSTYILDSHAKAQVKNAPAYNPSGPPRSYPKPFRNHEKLPIQGSSNGRKMYEYPVIPGQTSSWRNGGGAPGPARAICASKAQLLGVAYHDSKKSKTPSGYHKFSLATRHG